MEGGGKSRRLMPGKCVEAAMFVHTDAADLGWDCRHV